MSFCDPFFEMEVSHVLLNLPPDTRNLPVYLKVNEEFFPGFEPNSILPNDYIGKLGGIQAYLVSQQGFPKRAYFMFHITEGMEGTTQKFEVWLPDCPEPVYELQAIQIPVPKLVCTAKLNKADCEAAGGKMSTTSTTAPYCICP